MTLTEPLFTEFGVSEASLQARGLKRFPEAETLTIAEIGEDGREHRLTPAAAAAWHELKAGAAAAGQAIYIVSAFRSVERQIEIVRAKLESGQTIEDILTVSAFPGFSEHHTGCALDVGTPGVKPLELEFESSSAFEWLMEHAGRFGFRLSYPRDNPHGYQYEPWHWCYLT